jgi:hypothetical protein
MTLESPTLESGNYGIVVAYGGLNLTGITFMETSIPLGHQMLIGGGQCSAADATTIGRPCSDDADCGSGLCTDGYSGNGFSFRMNGGNTPGVTHERWAGVMLGGNLSDNAATIFFDNVDFGDTTSPANNTICDGAGNPYWFCRANNDSPAVTFPIKIAANGAGTQLSLAGSRMYFTGHVFWPYRYMTGLGEKLFHWSNNTGVAASGDCMRHDRAGFLATANCTVNYANEWAYPLHVDGGANHYNWFVKEVQCVHGSYDDGGEAAESIAIAARIGDNGSLINVGNAVDFVEGTTLPGNPLANYIGENTRYANCASGTCSTYTNPIVGLRVAGLTDATANNTNRISCTMRVQRSIGND